MKGVAGQFCLFIKKSDALGFFFFLPATKDESIKKKLQKNPFYPFSCRHRQEKSLNDFFGILSFHWVLIC